MLISDFYANREIFITGGTGFLGKALIEKLLRDSPKIKVLYIMLRARKSLSIEERLEQLKKDNAFERIRKECPELLNKLHAIHGDCELLGLDIQPSDLNVLQNVSIIFHMAANVKFDDPLRSSILLNTRGTFELIKIAENLKNLVVFMHCSTAFCNPLEYVVEEKVYSIAADWRKAIKIAETYDDETISVFFPKYTGYYPNSYTFTKNLSEQVIQEYSKKLPMFILRPSVVMNAYKEPSPGWIDNLNGPIATMVAMSIGILPAGHSRGDAKLNVIPIDLATKLTVVAAYKRGMQHLRKESIPNGLEVVNCVSFDILSTMTFTTSSIIYDRAARKNPMENSIWDYELPVVTSCYYHFLLQLFLLNIPLAILIDTILRCVNRKPIMIKTSRRIVYTMKALSFFTFNEYDMKKENMLNLENFIPQSEMSMYGFKKDIGELDADEYLENAVRGVKYNLFNQPPEATAAARKRAKILFIVSRSIKYFTMSLLLCYSWSIVSKY